MELIRRLRTNTLAFVGAIAIVIILLMAIFAPVIMPHDPNEVETADRFLPPGSERYILGTDLLGRDVLSRIILGSRVSLLVAGVGVGMAVVIGVTFGVIAAFWAGWFEIIIMQIADVLYAVPTLMIALGVVGLFGRSVNAVMFAIGVAYSPLFARVCHSAVVSIRGLGFVEASRAMGASRLRILWQDIMPNILPLIMVQVTVSISWAILQEAGLGFLGMSVAPPTPSWGTMLNEGREYFYSAPTMPLFTGLMVLIAVFSFNLFGDGLRDILDPRAWERLR